MKFALVRPTAPHLGQMLVLSFAFTIVSFMSATLISETKERGIAEAAESIAMNGTPSLQQLGQARTALRHLEVLLDDYTDHVAFGQGNPVMWSNYERARAEFDAGWRDYAARQAYPGERALWGNVTGATDEMNTAIDRVFLELQNGNPRGAESTLDGTAKPAIDRVDRALLAVATFNRLEITKLSERIESLQRSSRMWAILLDGLSAFFAIVAASQVIRVVRRFADLMQFRVNELEIFAGRVAHDIRSPLTSVGLALDIAKRSPQIDAKTQSILDRGVRTLQRVGQVVDGLLVFARAGSRPIEGPPANLREVLEGVYEEMRPAAEDKEVELRIEEAPSLTVACSPGVLTSIVTNLVGNALKYIGRPPVRLIQIRVREVGQMMRIEVEDTGPGIAPELRGKVFDPYVRAADSTIPGLGLGLATVRRLAEAHGGAVGIEATASKAGSLFWVALPRPTEARDAAVLQRTRSRTNARRFWRSIGFSSR